VERSLARIGLALHSCTPDLECLCTGDRVDEILRWLADNSETPEPWLAIDDVDLLGMNTKLSSQHFVRTTDAVGLTHAGVEEALTKLCAQAGAATPPSLRKQPKLDADGTFLPFPGVTIIWPLVCGEAWSELAAVVGWLAGAAYAPLPANSYHVTQLDVMTASKALATAAPSSTAWSEYLHARAPRLRRACTLLDTARLVPALQLSRVEVHQNVIGATFCLSSASDEAAAAELDRALVDALGLTSGRVHPFHLTLAYRLPGKTEDMSGLTGPLTEAVESAMAGSPLPLQPAHVSAFPDMTAFPPWDGALGVGAPSSEVTAEQDVPAFLPL